MKFYSSFLVSESKILELCTQSVILHGVYLEIPHSLTILFKLNDSSAVMHVDLVNGPLFLDLEGDIGSLLSVETTMWSGFLTCRRSNHTNCYLIPTYENQLLKDSLNKQQKQINLSHDLSYHIIYHILILQKIMWHVSRLYHTSDHVSVLLRFLACKYRYPT